MSIAPGSWPSRVRRPACPAGTTDSATAVVTPLPPVEPSAGLYVKAVSGNTVTLTDCFTDEQSG